MSITGSADLCFIAVESVEAIRLVLEESGIDIIEGPIRRTGAIGELCSIYFRDPDGNLIELSNRIPRDQLDWGVIKFVVGIESPRPINRNRSLL